MKTSDYQLEEAEYSRGNTITADAAPRVFTTTHWSMVIAAGEQQSEQADAALEKLCRDYWHPVYAFVRRSGWSPHDAEDLAQAFFERVLSKQWLRAVDRSKGKFRSFLLAMLKHFLANHGRDARALKRGGRFEFVSLDADWPDESTPRSELTDVNAVRTFERQWAIALLEQVMARLRQEQVDMRKTEMFDQLKVFLLGERGERTYSDVAVNLNKTEAALKMAVSRLRCRYGELLREEIARTVTTPEEAEEELRALLTAMA